MRCHLVRSGSVKPNAVSKAIGYAKFYSRARALVTVPLDSAS
jgi:hypothetical protein